jgi:hypothetical protein
VIPLVSGWDEILQVLKQPPICSTGEKNISTASVSDFLSIGLKFPAVEIYFPQQENKQVRPS